LATFIQFVQFFRKSGSAKKLLSFKLNELVQRKSLLLYENK